jgi:prolyl-tRNA synthetase
MDHTVEVEDDGDFKKQPDGHFLLAHWCGSADCEAKIKEETKATIRCIPFEGMSEKGKCILCGKKSEGRVIFAKAY